jgi:hypothetical protein
MHPQDTHTQPAASSTIGSARVLRMRAAAVEVTVSRRPWPAWRVEVAALCRLAHRRAQFAKAYAAGGRLSVADEVALISAQLADLEAVARLRAARIPASVIATNDGVLVEVGR